MAEPVDDPPIFRVFNEIGIIEQLSRNRFERVMPDGLKLPQFAVLNHLVRLGGGKSPMRIARAMQVTKGAMTNTLGRLETRGLIVINPDPDDGRGKLVDVTPAGRAMRARCIDRLAPTITDMSGKLDIGEVTAILPVLENIRKYLDENRG